MFDRYDPRCDDRRDREEDGVCDREPRWLSMGRGPGSHDRDDPERDRPHDHGRDNRAERGRERDDDPAGWDPRDVFVRDLDLPRGPERELVRDRDRAYRLSGSECRTLATAGAFRIVSERDLRDGREACVDGCGADLRHLRDEGLIHRVPVDGRDHAVALTDRGRSLLESHRRDRDQEPQQTFYARADKPRERTHDIEIYRAYLKAAERLHAEDARVVRVALDRELKREYQRFLQARNEGDRHSSGRPDRTAEEIEDWAHAHDLPYFDEQVHVPDLRVEYENADGDIRHLDLEVTTEHYRGAHGAAVARSGFTIHGSSGGSRSGRTFDPRLAEEFL